MIAAEIVNWLRSRNVNVVSRHLAHDGERVAPRDRRRRGVQLYVQIAVEHVRHLDHVARRAVPLGSSSGRCPAAKLRSAARDLEQPSPTGTIASPS